jgi:hypothetical protein
MTPELRPKEFEESNHISGISETLKYKIKEQKSFTYSRNQNQRKGRANNT